jgi:hypothetical protein
MAIVAANSFSPPPLQLIFPHPPKRQRSLCIIADSSNTLQQKVTLGEDCKILTAIGESIALDQSSKM